jgi:hypothetical protein
MKKYFFFILPLFLLAVFLFGLTPAKAQYGLDITAGKAGYSKGETPISIATRGVNIALSLVYIIFFILVLYAGIRWMTAQGNEEHVTKAKNILEAAIVGVVVISMAYAITNFVLDKVGANKTTSESAPVDKCVNVICPLGQSCVASTGECCDPATDGCTGEGSVGECANVTCPVGQECNVGTGECCETSTGLCGSEIKKCVPKADVYSLLVSFCLEKTTDSGCQLNSVYCTWDGVQCVSNSIDLEAQCEHNATDESSCTLTTALQALCEWK